MSASHFSVIEHTIAVQHVRQYAGAARSEQATLGLRLAVKEYRPRDNYPARPGSVTLIATHANGCPKETYEALWDELLSTFKHGKIGAIWMAEVTNQGASGVLNEHLQGDDPSWHDHARDLLHMVNVFRERMPRPLIGIGHSMGAAQLVLLSLMHPRLFHGLVLVEPVILPEAPQGPNAALGSSYRRDLWPSRAEATTELATNRFFKGWDGRALAMFLEHGLRNTPTVLYPEQPGQPEGGVTLTTSKAQEAWSFVRGNFSPMADSFDRDERRRAPDADHETWTHLFDRPEMVMANLNLPHLRPRVLWVFGEKSFINTPPSWGDKVSRTGTGVGGSGGAKAGNVEAAIVERGLHMLPMERPRDCATIIGPWLQRNLETFREDEAWYATHSSGKSKQDMLALSKEWLTHVRSKESTKRQAKGKL